jgi:type II secretory pathway pseudopilin PulG
MKRSKGFTLIELVVACTLLMILSTVATTTAENFVQSVKTLKTVNQVWTLKFMLTQAQLAYASAPTTNQSAVTTWNTLVSSNDTADLIRQLAPYFQIPAITDLTSLLQFENMYDPSGVTNPTIQLGALVSNAPPGTAALSTLPMVTWQGISH